MKENLFTPSKLVKMIDTLELDNVMKKTLRLECQNVGFILNQSRIKLCLIDHLAAA